MNKIGLIAFVALWITNQAAWGQTPPEESTPPAAPVVEGESAEATPEDVAAAEAAKKKAAQAQASAEPQALEGDTEAAQATTDVIDAAAASAPAAEQTIETIEAAPAEEIAPATATEATTVTAKAEEDKEQRTFGVSVGLEHALGQGSFVRNEFVREGGDMFLQGWSVSPYYNFELFGQKLKASARFAFEMILSTPTENPPRRFQPANITLGLNAPKLYEEPVTGISFSGGFGFFLPTSWEAYAKRQWTAPRLSLRASRELGQFSLSYSLGATKYLGGVMGARRQAVTRPGDTILSDSDDWDAVQMGFSNPNIDLRNNLGVDYSFNDYLSLGLSLGFMHVWSYSVFDERDQFTSPNAQIGTQLKSSMWNEGLELAYALSDHLGDKVALPVNVSLAAGLSVRHPGQSTDQKSYIWPNFYSAMANSRAANNYASFYLGMSGTY